ncbi:MAG: hypothetical protein KGZ43_06655 [Sulfuritalea sp.]|nr:hypothetical protein [Sulfuritalea sp.]
MREQWARRIALLTGLLVLMLAAMFAVMQNPIEPPAPPAPGTREQASFVESKDRK